jgi:phosphoribosylformylglycinamidine cyclo-ligase
VLHRSSWTVPLIFQILARYGQVAQPDLDKTFNLGVGMAAVVAPEAVDGALELCASRDLPAWILGEVVAGEGRALLV